MHSKRSLEGYLIIDNSQGAPVPEHPTRQFVGAGRGRLEAPMITCSHCHAQVVVNPARTQERHYCRKCDHYLCDNCALIAKVNGGDCTPMNKTLDLAQQRALKGL
jgi:hypothetical protein